MEAGLVLACMGFQALYAIGYGIDKVIQKFGKSPENMTEADVNNVLSQVETQNTTPPAPGSAPDSSSEHTPYGRYKPEASDLAYLLDDEDENQTPAPGYIVTELSEYGKKCIPLKVYVSALLRTWETALLLYLPFLYNNTQPNYSQTLILEVSPFLLEKRNKFDAITSNSDLPHDFAGNVNQFFNFIKLFIFFKKSNTSKKLIRGIAQDSLEQIPNNFTIILVAGNDKVYLRVVDGTNIEYHLPPNIPTTTLNTQQSISIPDMTIKNINSDIVSKIDIPSTSKLNTTYESYNTNRLTAKTPPRTIYSTFPVRSYEGVDFTNFENIGKYGPDIFSFLKWVIHIKSHPKNTPILFVSHSKTMNQFLKMMISNYNYNYTNTDNNFPPTRLFVDACSAARDTNTWSMRFKYLGYNVTGFRHAQSCDNMYKTLDKATSKMDKAKIYATLKSLKLKELYDRNKVGKYTNLSLWGIFSTLIFIHNNKGIISDFANAAIDNSGLMVLSGMAQQSKENIKEFGVDNELTCGDVSSRFLVSGVVAGAGASSSNYKQIENFVDIVPYSIPLYKMDITARQRMSNELCCLDSIFKIEFDDCDRGGCKIKVTYVGPSSLTDVDLALLKGVDSEQREEILKKIQNIMKRSVNINIDKPGTKYILTLQNVNPGGLVVVSKKLEVKHFFERKLFGSDEETKVEFDKVLTDTDSDEKIQISDAFQNSVAFLMGVDIFNTGALTYDALYNSFILYSNLLIRQLLNVYQLTSSDKAVGWGQAAPKESYTDTNAFLKESPELYGGKKNKKSKQKHHKNK
jgi:hypothetical protein